MQIDKYLEDARIRARRRKSPWNLILIPLAIAGMAGTYLLFLQFVNLLQNSQIPQDVILFGNTRLGNILKYCSLLFVAIPWGMIIANLIAYCISPARKTFEQESRGHQGTSFKSANTGLVKMGVIITLLVLPLSMAGAMNLFYVTQNGVTYRSIFSRKEYIWQDVKKVYAACYTHYDHGWELDLNYKLQMADGVRLDLWEENYDRFADSYEQIAGFLEKQNGILYQKKITADGLRYLEGSRYIKIRQVVRKIMLGTSTN